MTLQESLGAFFILICTISSVFKSPFLDVLKHQRDGILATMPTLLSFLRLPQQAAPRKTIYQAPLHIVLPLRLWPAITLLLSMQVLPKPSNSSFGLKEPVTTAQATLLVLMPRRPIQWAVCSTLTFHSLPSNQHH